MMNNTIGDILEKCPKGIVLYSPAYGLVKLVEVDIVDPRTKKTPMIHCKSIGSGDNKSFFRDGSISTNGDCILFPSKRLSDWDSFVIPVFCPGQTIIHKDSRSSFKIDSIIGEYYITDKKESILINQQLDYEIDIKEIDKKTAHYIICEKELKVLLERLYVLGLSNTEALDWILRKATENENNK